MRDTYTVDEARPILDELIHRASHPGQRITVTVDGQPAAVLIGARELADLEEALAAASARVEADRELPDPAPSRD
ncbi:type II toxin-antitoxin system prevent-host-death family antitoxin [Streptomyces sp. G45]|uniref:type II toxin-antitoxin system prevent-host-death family antitoxin n=1 Tax=Streptomyces sp. G45 TaxID=3406627 RepID=UPI003C206D48